MHTNSHTDTHSIQYTHMHMYIVYIVYACARVHTYIIIYISTAMLGENRICGRLRVLSSNPENILK